MSEQEDFYRREEDRKWRERADERLVSLTTDATVSNDRLDKIDDALDALDKLIRGEPEEGREGILEALHLAQREINKFNAVLNADIHGNGGLRNDINSLLDKRARSEKREGYFWHFATAAFVQFLILIGLIVVNWDRIQWYVMVKQHTFQAESVERETKRMKAERAKRRKVHHEQPSENVPE